MEYCPHLTQRALGLYAKRTMRNITVPSIDIENINTTSHFQPVFVL